MAAIAEHFGVHYTTESWLVKVYEGNLRLECDNERPDTLPAVEYAVQGMNGVMPAIKRVKTKPYDWKIIPAPLSEVANQEKKMPRDFITADGFHITQKCRNYLLPLIEGEAYPPYAGGLPTYVTLKNVAVKKKLAAFSL